MSRLFGLRMDQNQKERELAELQACQRELGQLQDEMIQQRTSVKQPELSPITWHGERANTFNDVREDMTDAYRDISHTQMNRALDRIESEISRIRYEIHSLDQQIAAERRRMAKEEGA
ncbi:DUF5082 domain-containing protein [Halobacillus litoralis]|uniref:YwqH-like family protein n=1 Tax=Halobacillus litoralis TaxID=45668 RepID=UPI001CD422E0|nr:DUF5082 family protein [Halobacillus litoralis]MCA0970755.1 DUF5082 domain-containing protein [Halobacillus litoralis]